jgi:hypothetical protein
MRLYRRINPGVEVAGRLAAMGRYSNCWLSAHIGGVGFGAQGTDVEMIPCLYEHSAPMCEKVLRAI